MSDSSIVDRLAALPSLASVPREQLEWLAAHGRLQRYAAGETIFRKGERLVDLNLVLAGRYYVRVVSAGVARRVREWKTGDISGLLPYSRMAEVPGDVFIEEPLELLSIPHALFREMASTCHEFTGLCVHEMVDRARTFKTHDLQSEKMTSLGRLSAGLAHELNNPASAVIRSAQELNACRVRIESASRELGAAGLTKAELDAVSAIETSTHDTANHSEKAIDRADREDAIADWLDERDLDASLGDMLADAGLAVDAIDRLARALDPAHLAIALRFVAASHVARRLTAEIQIASSRIHTLVSAMKNFTHRDQAPVPEPVRLDENLADTLTILRAEARRKNVTLELKVEPDLPAVIGVRGELNQVWLNLVDNAIDAVPASGCVELSARRAGDSVVVSVLDNGKGIPPEARERLFEPFFTTKPVGEGTGLGLETALAIVSRHNGTIEVDSRPGRTEFRVTLPIAHG